MRQTTNGINDLLASFTYNDQHLPLTSTDAAGQTTTFTYNPEGQLLTATNPLSEVSTNSYDGDGYLLSVDGALPGDQDEMDFTYDSVGRVRTVTEPEGYVLTFDYDDLDRVTRITYPDGTFEKHTYDRLDRVAYRDRLLRNTFFGYDALGRITSITDAENRIAHFEWCRCGDLRNYTDPKGRRTHWRRDIQGRVIRKEYADGSGVQYEYERSSGRLARRIDEKTQITLYDYNLDDSLASTSYPNAEVATPTVTFRYDPNYSRMTEMNDGFGTTLTSWYPVGTLGATAVAEVDGPWDNDTISYQYDELGRQKTRAINGVAETATFDSGGRIESLSNRLGLFDYAYVGGTRRLASVTNDNGLKTEYSYLPNLQDQRLSRIRNLKPDGTTPISVFDYTYDAIGRIETWKQQFDSDAAGAQTWTMGYDNVDQLTSVVVSAGGSTLKTHGWTYDDAGNRLTDTLNGVTTSFGYNSLNQLDDTSAALEPAQYEWDAEDRLRAIIEGSHRSEFRYDGAGRCREIRELENGSEVSKLAYLWDGLEMREERGDAGDPVSKRFFYEGLEVVSGGDAGSYLYGKDHLDSVREVVGATGTVEQRIRYSPWGLSSFLGGALGKGVRVYRALLS